MVTLIFPDRTTEMRALADQNISFTVKGKTTYERQMTAIRGCCYPSGSMMDETSQQNGAPMGSSQSR